MNPRDWTKGCTTTCPEDQWKPETELRAALQLVLRTNEPQRLNKGLHFNLSWGPMNPRDWTKGCTTTCPEDQCTPEIEQRAALQLVLRTNEPQRLNKGLHYNLSWGPLNSRDWTKGCTTTCPEEQWTPETELRAALQLVLRTMNPRDWTKGCTTTCPEDQWTPETELRAALQLVLRTIELKRLNKGLHYNLSWGPMNPRDWTKGCTTTCPEDQWTPEIEQRAALQLVLRTNEPQRLN